MKRGREREKRVEGNGKGRDDVLCAVLCERVFLNKIVFCGDEKRIFIVSVFVFGKGEPDVMKRVLDEEAVVSGIAMAAGAWRERERGRESVRG